MPGRPGRIRDEAKVDAARELYLRYEGHDHRRIEREMRAAGWRFSRRNLSSEVRNGKRELGWVERFGWDKEVEERKKERARLEAIGAFEEWLGRVSPGMTWMARHHRIICEHLRRVTEGGCTRLMIFVPPRHGKSELVTVRYAAWRVLQNPKMNIIIGSYSQKLANRFSRKGKRLAEGSIEISRRKHAVDEWETAAGGGVKAVGVGGGITGFGGDLVIIEDPVKSRAQANSTTFREEAWDWYKDDIHTRLEPGGAVILIQTRWHDDDLAGRLLKDMEKGGEKWDVVSLPALSEPHADAEGIGLEEPLWPERFSREDLLATKQRLGPWSFSALYQQRPVPTGGTLFRREWFNNIVSKRPEGLTWCRGYDLAVSLKDSADYTASFRVAEDRRTGTIYIADGFRARMEYPEQRRFVIERMNAETDTRHGIELALHGRALVQELMREPSVRGRALAGVKVDGDKLLRAESWAGLAEAGKIVLVHGPWVADFLDEVCRFTGRGDAHDDQVDAVSLAIGMLRKAKGGYSF